MILASAPHRRTNTCHQEGEWVLICQYEAEVRDAISRLRRCTAGDSALVAVERFGAEPCETGQPICRGGGVHPDRLHQRTGGRTKSKWRHGNPAVDRKARSEGHTSELQSPS